MQVISRIIYYLIAKFEDYSENWPLLNTQYHSYTDEQLFSLLQDGDEAAFTEIYQRYWKLLFAVAANKTGVLADAEEIVQEIFADLWKRRTVISIRHSLKAFLAGAVKFQVYVYFDKQHRQRICRQEAAPDTAQVEPAYDYKALEEQVHQVTAQLPERCRLVYELSRNAGLTHKEIARTLDISEKTVENQITKALKHLHAALRSLLSLVGIL